MGVLCATNGAGSSPRRLRMGPERGDSDVDTALIKARVTELYDRMQIEQLVSRYAHAVREKNVAQVMSLFVDENAAIDVDPSALPDGGRKVGMAEMHKLYADGFEKLDPWPHLINLVIDFQDSSHATGMVCLELRSGRKQYQVSWIGTYRDAYEKVDGVWKFRSREARIKHTPMLDV